jgi:hypothetical protein
MQQPETKTGRSHQDIKFALLHTIRRHDKMGSAEHDEHSTAPQAPHKYDPTFTDRVIAATGPKANARLAEVMPSLIRHLHDFARESNLTVAEWTTGVEFVSHSPSVSSQKPPNRTPPHKPYPACILLEIHPI